MNEREAVKHLQEKKSALIEEVVLGGIRVGGIEGNIHLSNTYNFCGARSKRSFRFFVFCLKCLSVVSRVLCALRSKIC